MIIQINMKTIKNFKQFVNEDLGSQDKYLSDEEIESSYDDFNIIGFDMRNDSSGFLDIEFPKNEDKVDNFIIYDNGHVAFDNWYPEKVYFQLVKYIANNHSNPEIKEKIYKAYSQYLKESMEELDKWKKMMMEDDKLFKEFQTLKKDKIEKMREDWKALRRKALRLLNDDLHSKGKTGSIMTMDVEDDELYPYLKGKEAKDFFKYARILDFNTGYKPKNLILIKKNK